MKWLNNLIKFKRIRLIYIDISNWLYVMKTIRKHKNTADWKLHNLRSDWVGRIYTVLNPQSPTDDGDTIEILKIKYTDRLKPINLYLDTLGLSYSVTVAYDQLPDTNSFLIVYVPIFSYITVWKVFTWVILTSIFFLSPLDTWTINGILYLYDLLMKLF